MIRAVINNGYEDCISTKVQSELFRCGDGRTVHNTEKRFYPVGTRGEMDFLGTSAVDGQCPGSMSLEDMRLFR